MIAVLSVVILVVSVLGLVLGGERAWLIVIPACIFNLYVTRKAWLPAYRKDL